MPLDLSSYNNNRRSIPLPYQRFSSPLQGKITRNKMDFSSGCCTESFLLYTPTHTGVTGIVVYIFSKTVRFNSISFLHKYTECTHTHSPNVYVHTGVFFVFSESEIIVTPKIQIDHYSYVYNRQTINPIIKI